LLVNGFIINNNNNKNNKINNDNDNNTNNNNNNDNNNLQFSSDQPVPGQVKAAFPSRETRSALLGVFSLSLTFSCIESSHTVMVELVYAKTTASAVYQSLSANLLSFGGTDHN